MARGMMAWFGWRGVSARAGGQVMTMAQRTTARSIEGPPPRDVRRAGVVRACQGIASRATMTPPAGTASRRAGEAGTAAATTRAGPPRKAAGVFRKETPVGPPHLWAVSPLLVWGTARRPSVQSFWRRLFWLELFLIARRF